MQNEISVKKKNFTQIFGGIIFIILAVIILTNPEIFLSGATKGIDKVGRVIIPSLFPFTVLSIFFLKSGGLVFLGKILNFPAKKFFGISGTHLSAVIISLLGGYPVGAKIINSMVKDNYLSTEEGQKLMHYAVNPSPAFYVSYIGYGCFKSKKIGYILLISNLLSCLILTALENKLSKKNLHLNTTANQTIYSLSDSFVLSIFEGSEILINISAWVILFYTLSNYLERIIYSEKSLALITGILEITVGSSNLASAGFPIFAVAFFLAFGGISTLCQVKSAGKGLNLTFKNLMIFRAIQGVVTSAICYLLLLIFPETKDAISNGVAVILDRSKPEPASITLIIFAIFFIIYIKKGKKV